MWFGWVIIRDAYRFDKVIWNIFLTIDSILKIDENLNQHRFWVIFTYFFVSRCRKWSYRKNSESYRKIQSLKSSAFPWLSILWTFISFKRHLWYYTHYPEWKTSHTYLHRDCMGRFRDQNPLFPLDLGFSGHFSI